MHMLIYKAYFRFPRCPNIIHTKVQYAVLPKNLQIEITYLTKSLNKAVTCVFTCVYTNTNATLQRAIYATIYNAISLYTNNVHMAVPSALRFTDIIGAECQNFPALHALLYNVIYNVIEA